MRFGHFDDAAREYVIETPRTPYPWINYLGTEEFFGLVSHTGGGYCFYRDARMRRLTRYRYNNVPTDVGGRYFYVHDGGDFWTPGWAPVKRELDSYECRHRPLVHEDHRRAEGHPGRGPLLRPPRDDRRGAPGHAEEHLEGAEERQALLVRRVLPVGRLGRPDELPAQPLDRRGGGRRLARSTTRPSTASAANHYAVHSVNAKVAGFDTDRESFLGPLERLRRAAGRGGGEVAQLRGQRLVADRLAPAGGGPRARARRRPSSSSSATSRTRSAEKWESPGVVNKKPRARAARALPDDRAGGRRARRPARLLDGDALEVHGEVAATSASTGWSTSGTRTSAW